MADLRSVLKDLQDRFGALSFSQKVLVVGIPVVVFSLVLTVLIYSLQPSYVVLYGDLSPEDMSAILTELDKEGVSYKVGADGRTVLVPEDKVRDIRLKLAAKGIPSRGIIGYELFDRTSIGVSEFQQRVNFKRAIEGELVRTILRLKNVEDARVHIALPERSIFLRDQEEPSASVFIKLKPGSQITPEQVKAIRNLVAASVEKLKPERVVVIDDRGRNLTAMLEEGEEVSSKQLKIRREFERDLERKIQTALEDVLGYGNVKVRVSADLEFTKVKKREEIYDPDMTAVVSEQKKKERTLGAQVGGVPGTAANVPPATGALQGQGGVITERKETITNYEVSKREIVTLDPTLRIRRISVGVIVNSEVKGVDTERIREIVSAFVGLDRERGDTISVVAVPFRRVEIPPAPPPPSPWVRYLVPAVAGLVLTALLLFGLMRFLRKKEVPAPPPPPAEEVPTIAGAEVLRERARELEVVKTITEVARKEPKKVAALIKTWLREE
jgi:flagellar M-ring protein FliF